MKFKTFFSFMFVAAALVFTGYFFHSDADSAVRAPASAASWNGVSTGYAFQGAAKSRTF